jgi:hypothetical protein
MMRRGVRSVTSQDDQPRPAEAAEAAAASVGARAPRWVSWVVLGCYLLAAFAVTWRLWGDPAGRMVAGDPGDVNLFAWFMRYSATAVSHGRLPALVTTGLNAPQGINLMWNTSVLLPGIVLAPVTLLAGPQTSLTVLLTLGFAGSAASLFAVLRRWGAGVGGAALGGAVYGFSPALLAAAMGHFHLQFAVLPPLIIDALLRIVTGRGRAALPRGDDPPRPPRMTLTGAWLGLLTAAQLFTGEELLLDTAAAAAVILAVLALSAPGAIVGRLRGIVTGLAAAVVVTAATSGYALWVQFRGPLASHGSPWVVGQFRAYPYAFVTPSGGLLFHTSASAAAAAAYPEPLPEYLAYLGWPLIIATVAAGIGLWADRRVRVAAVTFALLELFSLGVGPVKGIPEALLPWHWLQRVPVLSDVLPDRFAILADGAAGAVLAFAVDRARVLAPRTGRGRIRAYAAAAAAVLAVLPLVPRPLAAASTDQVPAGWQAVLARLRLASDAHVLVIPDIRLPLRWAATTGEPGSMVGGGATTEPGPGGQATSYIYNRRATMVYLYALWQGTAHPRPPSRAQIRADLAYWRLAAVVVETSRDSPLDRFLTGEFGKPAVTDGDVIAWLHPQQRSAVVHNPAPGKKGA